MELKWIKTIAAKDLDEVVEIHFEALSDSFLNNFGRGFIRKMYELLIPDPKTLTLVARHDRTIIGYLLVILKHEGLFQEILFRDQAEAGRIVADTLIRKPGVLLRALDIWPLLKPRRQKAGVELQFIAVSKTVRGRGLGTLLLKTLSEKLWKEGINQYVVGTKAANVLSNRFYVKNGFKFSCEMRVFGDELRYYVSPGGIPERRRRRRSLAGTGGS